MSLTRSDAVVELGKRLVRQLDVEDDLMASWMAHFVAERIESAESAEPETKAKAKDACAKAILELWQYRAELPGHLRPFKDLEAIQRTLASLDVGGPDYRYYSHALREAATAGVDGKTKEWLDFAIGLDHAARLLIQFALRSAVDCNADKTKPWIELAIQAGVDIGLEQIVVRLARTSTEADDDEEQEPRTAALKDKVDKLEQFGKLATAFAKELRTELPSR